MAHLQRTMNPAATAAGICMFLACQSRGGRAELLPSPDHAGQEAKPKSKRERGQRALLDCVLERVAKRRGLRLRAVGDDARADRTRHSPSSPYWRAHASGLASPAPARPCRYRSRRLKSGQKDRQSHLSYSPSPFPGGQRRCHRLCLAFRCFVQRRMESQMSSVPPEHLVNVNAGPPGMFRAEAIQRSSST